MATLSRRARVVPADWAGETDPARPTVAITFDDAFVSVADNALPELARHGLPCTVFAPSGVLGRRPDWAMEPGVAGDEIVLDADRLRNVCGPLVTIGSHSVSHPALTSHLRRTGPGRDRPVTRGAGRHHRATVNPVCVSLRRP